MYIKRICPSCINEFYPGDCEIVSSLDPSQVLRAAPKGWKRSLARINPEPIKKELTLKLARRRCMHCGYLLPSNIEQVESINIAIVGDTFSGKTHYIAALIHQIEQGEWQRAESFTRLACMTQDTVDQYKQKIIKPLFENREAPGGTQQSVFGEEHRPPLIYELILTPSPEYPLRRINLVLYDASGEDLAIQERMVQFSRYVFSASAIIFLADPNSMSEINKLLPPFLQNSVATGRTSSAVLNSIIQLIESYRGDDAGARLSSMPIAITVAKSDLLKQLTSVQYQYHFLKKPGYDGILNLQDLKIVDREVREMLADYGERPLLATTQNFSKVHFFATSATGYAPDKNGVYPRVEPCRCLDPILWILYELGILHAK